MHGLAVKAHPSYQSFGVLIMKKSLVALATMSVVASAFADVDVSGGIKMYGVLDQAYMSQQLTSASNTTSSVTTSGGDSNYSGMFAANATSRIGFKGARDLSEGLKGIFQIEIQLDPDTSTLLPTKNRTAFVGLQSADAGTIAFGTMETAAYEVFGMDVNGRVEYKPQTWRTTTSVDAQDRANNSIKYISPEFGGFNIHLQKSFSEKSGNIDAKSAASLTANTYAEISSIAVKYHKDKLRAALVIDSTANTLMGYKFAGLSNAGVSTTGSTDYALYYGMSSTATLAMTQAAMLNPILRNIASVSYDFGTFSANYLYAKSSQDGDYAGSNTTNTFGVKVPFDKVTVALSIGNGVISSPSTAAAAGSSATLIAAGRAKDGGTFSDATLGVYYNFDKSTSMYFLGSSSKSDVGVYEGSNTTVAIGARYNF